MIPLNDRPVTDRVITLHRQIGQYWADARNLRRALTNANLLTYFPRQRIQRAGVIKTLAGDSMASLEASFRSVFGWSAAEWGGFLTSAQLVHGTLAPGVLTTIKSNEASITESTIDAEGAIIFTNPISGGLLTDFTAQLQAIEDEFTL